VSFFQVDDNLFSNHKTRALIETEGFAKAAVAGYLWTLAGSFSRKSGTDGVITLGAATSLTLDRNAAKRGAALLVKYRLWHAAGHSCEACPQPPEGAWVFHQWFQFRYGAADAERIANDKRAERKNPVIIEAVWARDTHPDGLARCRYCAKVVQRPTPGRGGDRRSNVIGHLDHIDPTKAIGPTNIVIACGECNQTKAAKTPEQAGMTLLPAPTNPQTNPATNPIDAAINPGSSGEVGPTRARGGAGAGGAGVGPGRGGAVPTVPQIDRPWATGGAS
jgi:5-methylcytosine-specific restriction endonuclease McrA